MNIRYRPATVADNRACFEVFQESILDLGERQQVMAVTGGQDPEVLATLWRKREPLYTHLAETAAQFWVAEAEAGAVVGYARAIVRDGVQELTEFFVRPGQQSGGVGRELLARVFPPGVARHRVIIATTDLRAQARYLKQGVYPRFPIYNFERAPEPVAVDSDLMERPFSAAALPLSTLDAIDRLVLAHTRAVDHRWLAQERQGVLFERAGEVVGYGYMGERSGPFAVRFTGDWPAVLASVERRAAAQGWAFSVEVPAINREAVQYLLGRGCRIDAFIALFMSDAPFGNFEHYLFPSPPFFM